MKLKADAVRTMKNDRIVTVHVFPPIPDRRHDWCCYREEDVERIERYGWGRTAGAALLDLLALESGDE